MIKNHQQNQVKKGYRPRRQYDLTRDALSVIIYLSTSFFSELTDLIGDSLEQLELLSASSAPPRSAVQTFD